MYRMYDINRKIKDSQKLRDNISHMGNGEMIDFFEKRTDLLNNNEQILKELFQYASNEEKEVLTSILRKIVRKRPH